MEIRLRTGKPSPTQWAEAWGVIRFSCFMARLLDWHGYDAKIGPIAGTQKRTKGESRVRLPRTPGQSAA